MAYTADVFFLPGAWLACSLIVLSLFVFRRYTSSSGLRRRAEPPGPWGLPLPIVGYLPFLGRKMNLAINRLAKRYGNVFQLRIGSRKIVVISGQKSIRTALVDNATTFSCPRPILSCFTKHDTHLHHLFIIILYVPFLKLSSSFCSWFLKRNFAHGKKSHITPNPIYRETSFWESILVTISLSASKNSP